MNTVMETTLARLPPARLSTWSTCEKVCFTCASKLLAMSLPALSRVAVWPATQTVLPPSVITPGENARESWNGVFSMYSAAPAERGTTMAAASRSRRFMVFSVDVGRRALLGLGCFGSVFSLHELDPAIAVRRIFGRPEQP